MICLLHARVLRDLLQARIKRQRSPDPETCLGVRLEMRLWMIVCWSIDDRMLLRRITQVDAAAEQDNLSLTSGGTAELVREVLNVSQPIVAHLGLRTYHEANGQRITDILALPPSWQPCSCQCYGHYLCEFIVIFVEGLATSERNQLDRLVELHMVVWMVELGGLCGVERYCHDDDREDESKLDGRVSRVLAIEKQPNMGMNSHLLEHLDWVDRCSTLTTPAMLDAGEEEDCL
jgi:hypothetical protein